MARTVRDAKLESRSARATLAVRAEPHWKALDGGLALGYRRNKTGGVWLARRWDGGTKRYREERLGASDDVQDADGATILTFSQAQARARVWWQDEERRAAGLAPVASGPYTVANAVGDYLAARERKGARGVYSDRRYAETRITPMLGKEPLAKLTTAKLRRWHEELATFGKLVKTRRDAPERQVKAVDASNPDAVRARRATANRVLTILKAALNHAFHENHVASDESWRKVKPFREVDSPVVRYLNGAEAQRLVNACEADFRHLVQAALFSGARYGELTTMHVRDFDPSAATLAVRRSKSGKARHIFLTEDGCRLLSTLTAGRPGSDLIFTRNGKTWKASEQQRPLTEASKRAGIMPTVTFHILRHSHASALAMKGVPLEVIATQLGHADTRVTRRHYAHLSPSYVADTIRRGLGDFGATGEGTNVVRPPMT